MGTFHGVAVLFYFEGFPKGIKRIKIKTNFVFVYDILGTFFLKFTYILAEADMEIVVDSGSLAPRKYSS